MTALLNPRFWIGLGVVIALTLAGAFVYRAGRASLRGEFDAYKIAQQEAHILADRARTQRAEARQTAVNKEAQDGQERFAALEKERDAARVDGERMRLAYRDAAQRARELARAAAAGPGQPDSDPIGVFAGLLDRADRRAETVSGYADKLRAAGTICERSWYALKIK